MTTETTVKQGKGGKFVSPYKERRGRPIAIRLPESLDKAFFDHVGDRPYKPIIEQALREYLERIGA